jgi:hypothetical protein
MVIFMRYDRIGSGNTNTHAPARRFRAAQNRPRSNGFRLWCRLRAVNRQTDASPTTRWCLVVISMVYLTRNNRADARRSLDANSDRTAFRESEVTLRSAVTVTVPTETVGLRTKRLPHHRMMSRNVWDGWELVRRSYYGRFTDLLTQALLRRGVRHA